MHRWLVAFACAACGGGGSGVVIGPARPEPKTERVELAPRPTTTGTLPRYARGCSAGNELAARLDRREVKRSDGVVRMKLQVSLERPDCGLRFSEIVSLKGEATGRRSEDLPSGRIRSLYREHRVVDHTIEITNDFTPKAGAWMYGTTTSWHKLCPAGQKSYELTLRLHAEVEPPTEDKLVPLLVRCDA